MAVHPALRFDDRWHRSPDSLRFLRGLCSPDPDARSRALNCTRKTIDGWVEGCGSPPNHIVLSGGAESFSANDMKWLVEEQLPDLLRLSVDCPFGDVREMCSEYLLDLQERGIRIPRRSVFSASSFVAPSDMIPIDDETPETRAMLVEAFLQSGRMEHLLQVMALHPQYLEVFLKTQHFLLRGDGPLPFHCRHYIAIMAAARHRCAYLVHLHAQEYLLQGGDESWLHGGLDQVPEKLRRLSELNRILAHRPWLVCKEHIRSLVGGQQDKWSLSELMQALVLLAHFHALSSFVLGCGVSAEVDHPSGHSVAGRASLTLPELVRVDTAGVGGGGSVGVAIDCNGASKATDAETSIKLLMLRMRHLNGDVPSEISEDAMRASFERVEVLNTDCPLSTSPDAGHGGVVPPRDDVSRFVDDPDYAFEDIVYSRSGGGGGGGGCGGGGRGVTPFCTSDFSWEHEGYSLSCRLYMDVGVLLDDRFRVAKNLTYYTMGNNEKVDTTSFRHAIWHYAQCLHGVRHVEYDYSVVNPLLDTNIKSYVKAVTCWPDTVTRDLYDSFMHDFKHSEKVHVNLILLEARMQAELLYSLRTVSRYMCARDPAPTSS